MPLRYVYLVVDARDTLMVSGPAYDDASAAIEAAIASADEQSRLDAEQYFTAAATHGAAVVQDDSDVIAVIIDPSSPLAPPRSVVKRFVVKEQSAPRPRSRKTYCSGCGSSACHSQPHVSLQAATAMSRRFVKPCPEPSEENVNKLGLWLDEQLHRNGPEPFRD